MLDVCGAARVSFGVTRCDIQATSKITGSPFFILAVAVVVVVLPLLWLARLRRARRVSEQEQKALFEQRRLQPDYAAFAS